MYNLTFAYKALVFCIALLFTSDFNGLQAQCIPPAPVGPPACPLDLVQITQSAPTVTGLYGQFWQAGSVPATPIIDSRFANVNSISGPNSISSLSTHILGRAVSICNVVFQSAAFGEN